MMGKPRNGLAVWSHRVAASRTSLRSIRAAGAMCIAAGAVLVALLATDETSATGSGNTGITW
jgi:hypothetical protein